MSNNNETQSSALPSQRPDNVPVLPAASNEFASQQPETADEREQRTVHDVYETIAPHFSRTRYKPWPIIARFLSSIPPNSIGLDSGAGNGKYLPVLRDGSRGSWMIALDRSEGLLSIAKEQQQEGGQKVAGGEECVRGDLGFEGWRAGVFDFAISIAAIHHLSTTARRIHSIQALISSLHLSRTGPFARFIIYVWAFEQGENSKRKMGILANIEGDGERHQDVMVPWVLQTPQAKQPKTRRQKGPARNASRETASCPNVATDRATLDKETLSSSPPAQEQPPRQVYHRYYHLFVEGELKDNVIAAAQGMGFAIIPDGGSAQRNGDDDARQGGNQWLRVAEQGYEKDNWYLEGEVGLW